MIDGTGIRVQDVADWHEANLYTVAEMCEQFQLTEAEVYAALAYYFDHKDEIDATRQRDQEEGERLARENPSPFFARLRASGVLKD